MTNAKLRRVCVFCGSRPGVRPEYVESAKATGRELAMRKIGLVYGGASVGVMRAIADAALDAGGEVIGVIPRGLVDKEVANLRLADLRVVGTMHERKAMMADLCDGVIALPGGFGTSDELFEILTWGQLGMHTKPIGLLNVARFYDPLVAFVDHVIREGFVPPEHRRLLVVHETIGALLDAMRDHVPPPAAKKWIDKDEV
jgi:uncharacterized protein (TIGR00730 family)